MFLRWTLTVPSAMERRARLSIADGTVKVHRKNIYRKLHVGSRGELLSLCRAARR